MTYSLSVVSRFRSPWMWVWLRYSRRAVRIHRSVNVFARGACVGVGTTCKPCVVKTASNDLVYFVSRSRIRDVKRPGRFVTNLSWLGACWVTYSPVGLG